jgi:hypothetical protein
MTASHGHAPLAGTPTCSTLPGWGISSTCLTRQAPDITPAAPVLPRLVALFAKAVTSLDQFPYVQGSRPGIVSAQAILSDFWGQNLEAPPYPSGKVFLTRFGTVSAYAYRQGPYAPFMVELFAAGLFSRAPSIVVCPVARVAAYRLPTTAEVERAERAFVPNPLEGLSDRVGLTPLSTTAEL